MRDATPPWNTTPHVDGICYPVRHGLAGDLFSVALFGDKGEAPATSVLADPKTGNISEDLMPQASEWLAM